MLSNSMNGARKNMNVLRDERCSMRAAALLFLLASAATAQVQLCGPNLCNGSTVISHPQPPNKSVLAFRADTISAIYVSNSDCKRELYSVAVTGGEVRKLSDLPTEVQDPCFRNVTDDIAISPDGKWASWEADRDGDQNYELFSAPILGGPVVNVNAPLAFDHDTEHHKWSCDSARIIYRGGKDSANRWELFSALSRVPSSGQRISQVMGMSQAVGEFWVRCDGTVRYMADLTQSGVYKAFMTSVAPGGRIFAEIFADGFESGGVTRWN